MLLGLLDPGEMDGGLLNTDPREGASGNAPILELDDEETKEGEKDLNEGDCLGC